MTGPEDALAAIGMLPDAEIEPAVAALQLARIDVADEAWTAASDHLSVLARDASRIGAVLDGRSHEARIGALVGMIHARHGYRGDTENYDHADNANLVRVIERRRGLPVALGLIWLHCIRAAGWEAQGIDFPGHFLLTLLARTGGAGRSQQPKRILVDPFDNGAVVGSTRLLEMLRGAAGTEAALLPGMTRPMSNRGVLLRLQRNLLQRRLAAGLVGPAMQVLDGMLLIAPDVMVNWLHAAELNRLLDRLDQVRQCLLHVIDAAPRTEEARIAQARLDNLKS